MGWNDHIPTSLEYEEIAIEAGALRRCERHEEIIIDRGDPDAERRAYAFAMKRRKDGVLNGTVDMVRDGIKHAIDSGAIGGCPICDEERYRD